MNMKSMKRWIASFAAIAALMPISPVFAQSDMMGEHEMGGTVQKINHQKGTFQLRTHEGVLSLHFPPAAIKDVKNGDALTVHLAFKKGASSMPMQMK